MLRRACACSRRAPRTRWALLRDLGDLHAEYEALVTPGQPCRSEQELAAEFQRRGHQDPKTEGEDFLAEIFDDGWATACQQKAASTQRQTTALFKKGDKATIKLIKKKIDEMEQSIADGDDFDAAQRDFLYRWLTEEEEVERQKTDPSYHRRRRGHVSLDKFRSKTPAEVLRDMHEGDDAFLLDAPGEQDDDVLTGRPKAAVERRVIDEHDLDEQDLDDWQLREVYEDEVEEALHDQEAEQAWRQRGRALPKAAAVQRRAIPIDPQHPRQPAVQVKHSTKYPIVEPDTEGMLTSFEHQTGIPIQNATEDMLDGWADAMVRKEQRGWVDYIGAPGDIDDYELGWNAAVNATRYY